MTKYKENGKWICKKCWQINKADDSICQSCGASKMQRLKWWKCAKCGSSQCYYACLDDNNNISYTANDEKCYRCKTPIEYTLNEYKKFNPSNKREQDWICKQCGTVNPIWEHSCQKCGAAKSNKLGDSLYTIIVGILCLGITLALSMGLVSWCGPHTPSRPYHNVETGEGQYEYGGSREQKEDLERIDDYLKSHPDE